MPGRAEELRRASRLDVADRAGPGRRRVRRRRGHHHHLHTDGPWLSFCPQRHSVTTRESGSRQRAAQSVQGGGAGRPAPSRCRLPPPAPRPRPPSRRPAACAARRLRRQPGSARRPGGPRPCRPGIAPRASGPTSGCGPNTRGGQRRHSPTTARERWHASAHELWACLESPHAAHLAHLGESLKAFCRRWSEMWTKELPCRLPDGQNPREAVPTGALASIIWAALLLLLPTAAPRPVAAHSRSRVRSSG